MSHPAPTNGQVPNVPQNRGIWAPYAELATNIQQALNRTWEGQIWGVNESQNRGILGYVFEGPPALGVNGAFGHVHGGMQQVSPTYALWGVYIVLCTRV